MEQGHYQKALEEIQPALKSTGTTREKGLVIAAEAAFLAGLPDSALHLASRFLKEFPTSPLRARALWVQGLALETLGQRFSAIQAYVEAWKAPELRKRVEARLAQLLPPLFRETLTEHLAQGTLELRLRKTQTALLLLPLSGPAENAGKAFLNGLQLGLKENLDLFLLDANRLSEPSPQELKRPATIAVGPLLSRKARAWIPALEEALLPGLLPAASDLTLCDQSPWIFSLNAAYYEETRALAHYAVEKLGKRRFLIFYPENGLGISSAQVFSQEIRRLGAEVLETQSFALDSLHFPLDSLLLAEAEGVFIPTGDIAAFSLASSIHRLRPGLPIFGLEQWISSRMLTITGGTLDSLFVAAFSFDPDQERARESFRENFQKAFYRTYGHAPSFLAERGYDVAGILNRLFEKGPFPALETPERLQQIGLFPGISGNLLLDRNREPDIFLVTFGTILKLEEIYGAH